LASGEVWVMPQARQAAQAEFLLETGTIIAVEAPAEPARVPPGEARKTSPPWERR